MLKITLLLLCAVALGTNGRSLSIDSSTARPNQPNIDRITQYMKMVLENLKQDMPNGIPQLGIPPLDPLKIDVIDVPRIQEGNTNIKIGFKDFNLRGLSRFHVVKVKGDLANMNVELELTMPHLRGSAHYDSKGWVVFIPLYGNGNAQVQVNELKIKCRAAVGIKDMKKVQLTDFFADLSFGQLQIQLENLFGGGKLGELANRLLNHLGKRVYDSLKHLILPELNRIVLSAINNELAKVKLQDVIGGMLPLHWQGASPAGDAFVDWLMGKLRPVIVKKNLDPLALPTMVKNFRKYWPLSPFQGRTRFTNGTLTGLSTVHRTDGCHFNVEAAASEGVQVRMTVRCEVGVRSITGQYSVHAEIMANKADPLISFAISDARMAVQMSGSTGASLHLDTFNIVHMPKLDVRVGGFGLHDRTWSQLASAYANGMKAEIVNATEARIRNELEDRLDRLVIPKF